MRVSEFYKFPRTPNARGGYNAALQNKKQHVLRIGDVIVVRSFTNLQQNIWLRHVENMIYPWPLDDVSTCGFKVVKLKK